MEISYSKTEAHITVPLYKLNYLDEFIKYNEVAKDFLALDVFPNAKEITESFAAVRAFRKYLRKNFPSNGVIVVIGDGNTPRTGVSFAFKTPFNVISIDPQSKFLGEITNGGVTVDRLISFPYTLQEATESLRYMKERTYLLVGVHPHVPSKEIEGLLEVAPNIFGAIEIPCCQPREFTEVFGEATKTYRDMGIHSPHNWVNIWKFPPINVRGDPEEMGT